ncbi:MAG: SH3 domain-containing protein [Candidatus Aminicenantes bacterium]|nr:SH3 domain-containing protein [Candidatus Aminicenantes bacterium]
MNRKAKIFVLGIFILSSLIVLIEAGELKVIVSVEVANVRLKPSIESAVIGKAKIGQVLEVLRKEGNWYFVNLPPDENGFVVSGYIHQSIVKVVTEDKPVPEKKPVVEPKPQVTPPPPQPSRQPSPFYETAIKPAKRKAFYIRAGAGYGTKSYSYSNNWNFTQYQEQGDVNESYSVDTSGLAYEAGLGFLFIKNVGLEISFAPVSSETKGAFTAAFPHPFYFDKDRTVDWNKEDLAYAESEINLNLILYFPVGARFNIYISGGGTYFLNVKAENLQEISWSELGYPYNDLTTSYTYNNYSNSGLGFNAGGGIDFFFVENVGLNVNVRYSSGTVKVEVEGVEIKLKPGGLKVTGGIKIAF